VVEVALRVSRQSDKYAAVLDSSTRFALLDATLPADSITLEGDTVRFHVVVPDGDGHRAPPPTVSYEGKLSSGTIRGTLTFDGGGHVAAGFSGPMSLVRGDPLPPPPPLALVPMTGRSGDHTIELRQDGSVLADGNPMGRLVGAELEDVSGSELLSVTTMGNINGKTFTSSRFSFSEKPGKVDQVVAEAPCYRDVPMCRPGPRPFLYVEDSGAVVLYVEDPSATRMVTRDAKIRFVGFTPAARRTASVLALILLAHNP